MRYVFVMFFLGIGIWGFAGVDSLMNAYKKMKKDTVLFNSVYSDARKLRAEGRYDDSKLILLKTKKYIYETKSLRFKGSWNMQYGLTLDYSGFFDSAIIYYKKSLAIYRKMGNQFLEAPILTNLGIAHIYKGESKQALAYLLKALKIADKKKMTALKKTITMNIGAIYFNLGDYHKAYQNYMKRISEDPDGAPSDCYYNIGIIHFKWGNLDSSEHYLKINYDLSKKSEDKLGMADALASLGAIDRRRGKFSEAAAYYQESMKLMHELDATVSYMLYLNASLLYAHLQNTKLALAYNDTATMIVNKSPSREKTAQVYHSKAQVMGLLGKYKEAYSDLLRYTEINDSIYTDANTKEIENLKVQYDLEKKTSEVKLKEKIKSEKQKAALEAKAEEQDARNRTILISVLSISVIIVIFAMIVYRRFQISKKQNRIIALQKKEVEHQKELVDEKNKEIVDSINYAKRLQEAILPSESNWNSVLPDSFIYYRPKDIVAGDFYWLDVIEKNGQKHILFAAADCTGHGVPGALVSVVCSNALNRSVNEFGLVDPGKILDKTTDLVIETFIKSGSEVKDGMDISLVALSGFSSENNEIKWAGANNSLWIIREEELLEWKADKQPVGMYFDRKDFTTHKIEIRKGDLIYVFSDGYGDQFGGEKKKKFKESSMKKLLVSSSHLPMAEQRSILEKEFLSWKGELEQIDDVCIIGVKI